LTKASSVRTSEAMISSTVVACTSPASSSATNVSQSRRTTSTIRRSFEPK
jgi:hypothetical protein